MKPFYKFIFLLLICLSSVACSEQSLDEELRELCKKENVYYVVCQISETNYVVSAGYKFDNGRVYLSPKGKKWSDCYNLNYMIKYCYATGTDGHTRLYIYFGSEVAHQSL